MFDQFFRQQGPQPLEFLGKSDTVRRLHGILDEARKSVVLISPYVSIDKLRDLERKIRQTLDRKVEVTLVIRAEDESTRGPSIQGQESLTKLLEAGLKLACVKDLHAKLYYSERHALITSLNLLESSFNNSIEIGVWVPAERAEYAQITAFVKTEIAPHLEAWGRARSTDARRPSPPAEAKPRSKKAPSSVPKSPDHGFCIRCCCEIEFSPDEPYCDEHFAIWNRYGDPNYTDKHCHLCGTETPATMNKPLCRPCFFKNKDPDDIAF
ncbi:hypothetical protein D7V97_22070 [Corallococcus sp. CA053C]|nr:hypothetical protein D7V97_22070 [Corallococcus sp. CA053C]